MEHELLTLPEHVSSPTVLSGVRVTRSLILCVCFVDRCLSFVIFRLAIVLSVLPRYAVYDYPFVILKLLFNYVSKEKTTVYGFQIFLIVKFA